jgi:hypothetical protein
MPTQQKNTPAHDTSADLFCWVGKNKPIHERDLYGSKRKLYFLEIKPRCRVFLNPYLRIRVDSQVALKAVL